MKTKTLFFAMLLTVSTAAFALGKDKPGMTVVAVKGSEVFKVIYQGETTGKIRLNIFDEQGRMIHSETIVGLSGFICPLNFKGLQSGNYTIELVDGTGKHREKVVYLPVSEMKSIHVSKLRSEEGKFLFVIANAQDEPIRLKIYDERKSLVYEETRTISGDFAQVYKMANKHGRYTFEVADVAGNQKYFTF
ncbi:MAG: T9SS type A sorting domain-containing protein [Cyclobacteriaceae bacterium]